MLPVGMALLLAVAGCSTPAPPRSDAKTTQTATATTGIPTCDAYLKNYLVCHRTAGIYNDPATLASQYEAIRDGLLQDAHDPQTRPYLAHRCAGLIEQLDAAVGGRSCAATAANTHSP